MRATKAAGDGKEKLQQLRFCNGRAPLGQGRQGHSVTVFKLVEADKTGETGETGKTGEAASLDGSLDPRATLECCPTRL